MSGSRFNGRRIQPPDAPNIVRTAPNAEVKAWALKLHSDRPELSNRQIARMIYRQFDIPYSATAVGVWFRKAKETQDA